MLILQNISYQHPNKDILFTNLSLVIKEHDKIALVGNNGTGKSTLLKIMAGILQPSSGTVLQNTELYYMPQHFGQFNDMTIAQALRIDIKLKALKAILEGEVTEKNMTTLNDDWTLEERCAEALKHWQLAGINLEEKMGSLSGGQKTKVLLAGIHIHDPQIILLDEPSNHLDMQSREILYDYIRSANKALVIVSHDRTLLDLLNAVCELSPKGITAYGGNYQFYKEQKKIELNALQENLEEQEKALRKARAVEREANERQQKLDARGKKKQEKSGVPTIMMNTLRNNAEKSTSKMKDVHAEKISGLSDTVNKLRKELPTKDKMKIGLDDSSLHTGKVLVLAQEINYGYDNKMLWDQSLSFQINSGQRVAIRGANGSGKTTLIKLMLGILHPVSGTIMLNMTNAIYIDQDYSLVDNELIVYEQAQQFNTDKLEEHEVKSKLTHFLFNKAYWDKPCKVLSGGEKMRLILCCLTLSSKAPDIIVLDEPTNNLDIQNIEMLTDAIRDYKGTVIAISHDQHFLHEIGIEDEIIL